MKNENKSPSSDQESLEPKIQNVDLSIDHDEKPLNLIGLEY